MGDEEKWMLKRFLRNVFLIAVVVAIYIACWSARIQSCAAINVVIPDYIRDKGYEYIVEQESRIIGGEEKMFIAVTYFYTFHPELIVNDSLYISNNGVDGSHGFLGYIYYLEGNSDWSPESDVGGRYIKLSSVVQSTVDIVSPDGTVLFPANGSSSGGNSYAYDSNIPAPQNLKLDFLDTKVGILGLSRRTDLQLSWSNALVDDYSVQISANITTEYTPGEGNQTHGKKTFTHKLVGLSQVDSGGADAGYPASSGKYTITEDELLELAKKEMDKDYAIVERAYVNSFRVQFYKIDSGVINVGPIGVVNLSYSFLGKYQGSTTTTEYPSDSSDIGEGGLMPDDSGKWSGDGSGWEYDENGNITGSSDGSSSVSWSDALKSLLNGLINIPTIIASMFESLTSMMAGIGQFPAFLAQAVSWLPSEIVSLISLGITVVIVLRIFGR